MGSGWYFPVSKNQLPGLLMGTDLSPHLVPLPLKLRRHLRSGGTVLEKEEGCDAKVRAQLCSLRGAFEP